jgi:hypothetical protein
MKPGYKLLTAVALALVLAVPAQALTITPTSGSLGTTRYQGNETGQAFIDAVIGPIIAPASTTPLYKATPGSPVAEDGVLAGSYSTVFSNTSSDPSNATITYIAGPYVGPTAWALVKDGNNSPAWYLFNLTALGWNGTALLEFQDFWPAQGAISHVSLYGGSVVPDGGSMVMLLGLGLMGLAGVRRLMK